MEQPQALGLHDERLAVLVVELLLPSLAQHLGDLGIVYRGVSVAGVLSGENLSTFDL